MKKNKKGFYIVLEGIVGSGKTTQAKLLFENLQRDFPEREIQFTYEPGGTEIADAIRVLVQGTKFRTEDMEPVCEAYLYAASRAHTLRKIVRPVLDRGGIVVSDRSFVTSIGNQGNGRGLGYGSVLRINKIALDGVLPDIIFFVDVDLDKGIKRTQDHDGDKFADFDISFYEKVREGYEYAAKFMGKHWKTIDGNGSIEDIQSKIYGSVSKLLGRPQLFK